MGRVRARAQARAGTATLARGGAPAATLAHTRISFEEPPVALAGDQIPYQIVPLGRS